MKHPASGSPPGILNSLSCRIPFLLAAAGLLVFSNSFSNSFHLDDFHTIVHNWHIHSLSRIPSFFTDAGAFSGTPSVSGYRPLTLTVNALNYWFSGDRPRGYHLVNLLIHILSSLAVFRIASLLSGSDRVALPASLLFLVHPMNTESVNYISARSSTLSALFYLAAFYYYLRYSRDPRLRDRAASFLFLILSLLSKETAVTFPLLVAACDYFLNPERSIRDNLKAALPYTVPVIFYLATRQFVIHAGSHSASTALFAPGTDPDDVIGRMLFGAFFLSSHYLLLYLFPYPLSFDHPFPVPAWTASLFVSIAFWVIVGIGMIRHRKQKLVPFLVCWYVITLLPLFALPALSTLTLFQESRSYLSGVSPVILIALGFRGRARSVNGASSPADRLAALSFALLLVAAGIASYERNMAWKTEETVWSDVLRKNPGSFIATFSIGYDDLKEGKAEEAERAFQSSLKLSPPGEYLYYIHNNLGAVYESRNEPDRALVEYQAAERYSDRLPEAHLNLARLYLKKGAYEDAGKEALKGWDLDYSHLEARVRIAQELKDRGAGRAAGILSNRLKETLPRDSLFDPLRKILERDLQDVPSY